MNSRTAELMLGPIRAIRRAAIVWTAFIASMVLITVAMWPAFKDSSELSSMMDQLPTGLVEAFGLQAFGTPAGFLRGNLYDFFIPLLMAGAAVGFANTLTSSEEDAGRLELTLSQPVTRQAVFLGRTFAVCACVIAMTVITALVQFGADALFGLEIGSDRLLATLVLSGLLALFIAAVTLAAAGVSGQPSLVLGVGLIVAIGGSVVAALFPLTSSLAEFAHISPWDWALAGDPLLNPTDPWRYAVLLVPAIVLMAIGGVAFSRRDVSSA